MIDKASEDELWNEGITCLASALTFQQSFTALVSTSRMFINPASAPMLSIATSLISFEPVVADLARHAAGALSSARILVSKSNIRAEIDHWYKIPRTRHTAMGATGN